MPNIETPAVLATKMQATACEAQNCDCYREQHRSSTRLQWYAGDVKLAGLPNHTYLREGSLVAQFAKQLVAGALENAHKAEAVLCSQD